MQPDPVHVLYFFRLNVNSWGRAKGFTALINNHVLKVFSIFEILKISFFYVHSILPLRW